MLPSRPHIPRRRAGTFPVLLVCALLCAPAAATAQEEASAATGGLEARPGELDVRPVTLAKRPLSIAGVLGPEDGGRTVRIERRRAPGEWQPLATAVADADGAFTAAWRARAPGRYELRAAVVSDTGHAAAAGRELLGSVTVFTPAVASWYGPGFFGRTTACGVRLNRRTVGVAHRTLPCGTKVEVLHRGRTLVVPVIDRGPFVAGRQWDLTQAAAKAFGMSGTARVGVLRAARK